MKKAIAAFNMTLGIVCNNTTLVAKEELHHPYSELVNSAATYFLRAHNLPTHAILANTIAQPLQQKNQTQQRN